MLNNFTKTFELSFDEAKRHSQKRGQGLQCNNVNLFNILTNYGELKGSLCQKP